MKFCCYTFNNFIGVVVDLMDLFGTNIVTQLDSDCIVPDDSIYITSTFEYNTNTNAIQSIILKNKNLKILVDVSTEGNADIADYEPILDFYKENSLDIKNLIFLTNNANVDGITKYNFRNYEFNLLHYPGFINMFLYPHLLSSEISKKIYDCFDKDVELENRVYFEYDDVSIHNPSSDFLILNRTLKDYKLKLLETAFKLNFFKNYKIRYTMWDISNVDLFQFDINFRKLIFNELGEFEPKVLPDETYNKESMPHDSVSIKNIFDSKVHIICESTYNDDNMIHYDDMVHLSEKTWRCLCYGVPFVISSNKNCLKAIQNYGFKTFNSIIDESYDITVDSERMDKVLYAAKELLEKSDDERVKSICQYNRKLYRNKKHKKKYLENNFLNYLEIWK